MTVAELIDKLQTLPQGAQVVIDDADTGWALALDGVGAGEGTWAHLVVLRADYGDRLEL